MSDTGAMTTMMITLEVDTSYRLRQGRLTRQLEVNGRIVDVVGAYAVSCSYCGADVGAPCVVKKKGRPVQVVHRARQDRYRREYDKLVGDGIVLKTYFTRNGRMGVDCICGRHAQVTVHGFVHRHSPKDPARGEWCPVGGRRVVPWTAP